jgi:guanylate cyclase
LEDLYERAEEKAKELQVTHELLDEWKRRGDELLYSMIPESIAESLRRGKEPVDTCEVRLQSYLVSFVNLYLKVRWKLAKHFHFPEFLSL